MKKKCSISVDINEGQVALNINEVGAKAIVNNSSTYVRMKDMSEQIALPTKAQLDAMTSLDKGASYIFSNIVINQDKADVILPIGTSGSGKSTWIKSLPQKNLVIISPDKMRVEFTKNINDKSKDVEIYKEAAVRAIKAIKQGKQVVFDTTNLVKAKRVAFINAIKNAIPSANIQYKLMELNPELAKQRIKADLQSGTMRANVSDSTIDRHAASYPQMLIDIKSENLSNYDKNIDQVSSEGLQKLGIFDDEDTMNNLVAAGANLYKDIANDFFSGKPDRVVSTINNNTQIIFEGTEINRSITDRDFLHIGRAAIKKAKAVVDKEFGNNADEFSITKQELYEEGMEFLIISALYRGFDISMSSAIDKKIIDRAINRYNIIKQEGKKVVFGSSLRGEKGITKAGSLVNFINNIDSPIKSSKEIVEDNTMVRAFLGEDERTTMDKARPATFMSKLIVGEKIISVFRDMMPNMKIKLYSRAEIRDAYGPLFAEKKNFIIGGTIVLNVDDFTPNTLFHEFSHYYIKWLSSYNVNAYEVLIDTVKRNKQKSIPGYTTIYSGTGLTYSDNEIIEEIFADEIGMLASQELQLTLEDIDPADSEAIEVTVTAFAQDFIRKLTKNAKLDLKDTAFTVNSSIAEIFNIGAMHANPGNLPNIFSYDTESFNSLRDFFIQKASPKDVFIGLIGRGLIREIGPNKVIFLDIHGNQVDLDGNSDTEATYSYYPWDSEKGVKNNKKLINDAAIYLEKNMNYALARFEIAQTPVNVASIVNNTSYNIALNEEGTAYVSLSNPSIQFDRVSSHIDEHYRDKQSADLYIISELYSDRLKFYTNKLLRQQAAAAKEEGTIIENTGIIPEHIKTAAAELTATFMADVQSSEFRLLFKDIKDKYDFKTSEGTYMHAIAEFYFRALNYSQKINYKNAKEDRSITHFAKDIRKGIGASTEKEFVQYFENTFFSYLKSEHGTKEYKSFLAGYEFIKEAMKDRAESSMPALDFLRLIDQTVLPIITGLRGPITILPEVRVASEKMKLAGTIDLLIIDGAGIAHIFDYKTKEIGKRAYWDWKSGTNMKGVMSSFKDNAMMKASVQTSLYKLMLKEMGIQVGPSNVFYVESMLPKAFRRKYIDGDLVIGKNINVNYDIESELESEAKKLREGNTEITPRYSPENIYRMGVQDVSADLLEHFKELDRAPEIDFTRAASADVNEVIIRAAGGRNIDQKENLQKHAEFVYNQALKSMGKEGEAVINVMLASLAAMGSPGANVKKGLRIYIGGKYRYLSADLRGRDEHIAAIIDLYKNKDIFRDLESELLTLFDSQDRGVLVQDSVMGSRDREVGLRSLIRDSDFTSHELIKLSSDVNFGMDFSGIMMLKNKTTQDVRLLILNPEDEEEKIYFGSKDRSNVFGNYISNNAYKVKFPTKNWPNTIHNMRLIKAGLVLVLQKMRDKDLNVNMVLSNSGLNKNSTIPVLNDLSQILSATKFMLELMRDNGEVLPQSFLNALDREDLFESRSYIKNPIDSLLDYLEMSGGDHIRYRDLFVSGKEKINKDNLTTILKNYNPNDDVEALKKALDNYRKTLSNRLNTNELRVTSDLWMLTDQIKMYLENTNYSISPKNTTFQNNITTTPHRMGNKYGKGFARKITENTTEVRDDFMNYKNIHNKHLEALAAAYGIQLKGLGARLRNDAAKSIFKRLYTTDNSDASTAFILKDPSQLTLKAEKDYVEFLRNTYQKFGVMGSYNNVSIPYGWMPLVKKTGARISEDEDIVEKVRRKFDIFNFNKEPGIQSRKTFDDYFNVESPLASQIPGEKAEAELQYTRARQKLLHLDETGTPRPYSNPNQLSYIEDNLENATDAFVLAALEAYHYKDASEYGRALYYTIQRYERITGEDYSPLIQTLSLIKRRVIDHEESNGDNRLLKAGNKIATTAAITGSAASVLLETFTNTFATADNLVSDKLYGLMFKGNREYTSASYAEAFKLVNSTDKDTKKIITALSSLYGIIESDTARLKEVMRKVEKEGLFKTDNLLYLNRAMLEVWQKVTMVAYMLEQGSFYAHSLDEDGNLIYDEKKDKRFHFYLGTIDPMYNEKKSVYDAYKAELAKQRTGLNDAETYEEKTLKRAWTGYETTYVKDKVVELYSSLDDTSKSLVTFFTQFGFFTKMRMWLFAKTARYFESPMTAEEGESAARLVRVVDEDGNVKHEWKGETSEGIVYTLHSMMRQVYEYRGDVLKKGSLTERQKKNITYLASDLITWTFLSGLAAGVFNYALDDEQRKSESAQLIYKRWIMASKDMFLPINLVDLFTGTGSLAIGLAIIKRAILSAGHLSVILPQALIDPDTTGDDVASAANTFFKDIYGPYKTVNLVYTEFTGDEMK